MANTRYELRLRAPIAHTLLDMIRARFDDVSTPGTHGTVLVVQSLDQASIRALLTLLWDTGNEVLSFEETNRD